MLSTRTLITCYSHGMKVIPNSDNARRAVKDYCYNLAHFEWVKRPPRWKPIKQMTKVFAGRTKDCREYRFHINNREDILRHLSAFGVNKDNIIIDDLPVPTPVKVTFKYKKHIEPRDNQVGLVAFLSNPDQKIKVTNLQTGQGKTIVSLMSMVNLGLRTVIQLKGGFIHRWFGEFVGSKALLDMGKNDLLVVRGSASLKALISMGLNGTLEAKVIIISNKTLYFFFKEYEELGANNSYGCSPEELYGILGAGLRIVDEVHDDYHLNFRSDIYSNILTAIMLSATLDTQDKQRKRMYDISMPKECWYSGVEYVKYVGVVNMVYLSDTPGKIRCTQRGKDSYNHGEYEKSIMKDREMLKNYLKVIRHPVQEYYVSGWLKNTKCIVFCYLVEFVHIVRDFLAQSYPDLTVSEYTAETDEAVLARADIIVSTVKSAGTAQDIAGLRVAVLSHALDKQEANEQVKGRLRQMKEYPEETPVFIYLTNQSIPAHVRYADNKREQFNNRCLYHRTEDVPHRV